MLCGVMSDVGIANYHVCRVKTANNSRIDHFKDTERLIHDSYNNMHKLRVRIYTYIQYIYIFIYIHPFQLYILGRSA